eukprot:257545-Hanusia_phi.AAC.1
MSTSATSVQMPQVSMQFVGETLLIRQCYRDVKKIIADNFGLDEITLKQREKLNYFRTLIISGNPGIGKTFRRKMVSCDIRTNVPRKTPVQMSRM